MSGGSKVQTTRTEPWEAQKPYLRLGSSEPKIYIVVVKLTPDYYGGGTLAGFDPAELAGQQSALTYLTGPRAANLQAGAETGQPWSTMVMVGGAMDYGAGTAAQPSYSGTVWGELTPFTDTQYGDLLSWWQ